jgi:type II secretory pathway component PulM
MIGSLIRIGLLLVAAVLVYNYFWGTDSERDSSKKIFGQMRDVVVSVGSLVKAEKNKFDAGKYDNALEKLGGAYRAIRDRAQHVDEKLLKRLDELEQRKARLEEEIDGIEQADQAAAAPAPSTKKGLKKDPKAEAQQNAKAADQARRKEQLQRELEALIRDSDSLLQQAAEEK